MVAWSIRTTGVGKEFPGGVWGIRNVSLTIERGAFVALLGANGAGKSTLIHLICGALNPTEGAVEIGGDPPLTIGWCSQRQSIDWYLNVENNVMIGPRLMGRSRRESAEETRRALALVRLSDYARRPVDGLSGGQQQRVQIARVLASGPQVLILDEPTTGLDADAAEQLLDHLRTLADGGVTVLVSSHDIGLLEKRSDAVLLLADGGVVTFEPTGEFLGRFAADEIIEITYAGTLDEGTLTELERYVGRIHSVTPLRITVPGGTSIGDILRLLERGAEIVDIRRQTPGLREAYLAFARNPDGHARPSHSGAER